MTDKEIIRTSKLLSLVLRHEPEQVGLKLGEAGWVNVDELLLAVNSHGVALTLDRLKHVVATSDKKRFAFSEDGRRIRASQGHSVEVDLQYQPQTPPEILYHGTATRFLDGIRKDGLQKMGRHDVHLSAETKVTGLDGRTTGSLGYQTSQKLRKRVEEIFGWAKEIGGLRRTRKRGTARMGLSGLLILSAYNLVRMGKLLGNST